MPGEAFFDIPGEAYPFTMEFINDETGEALETIQVTGPGAIHIPGQDVPTRVRITYANGEVSEMGPPEVET